MPPNRKRKQPAVTDDRIAKRVTPRNRADTRTDGVEETTEPGEASHSEAAGAPGEGSGLEDTRADKAMDELDVENASGKAQSETADAATEPDDVRPESDTVRCSKEFDTVPFSFGQRMIIVLLIKPYRLANKLQDQVSADTLIDKIAAHTQDSDLKQLTAENLIRAWEMAPPESTLCNVLVDSVILQLAPVNLNYYLSARDFPRDFALEIARKLAATAVGLRAEWTDQLSDSFDASRTAGAYHRFGTIDQKFKDARVPPDAPATVTGEPAE
ncbi:hypothetical protein LTR27_001301 [Elasticomyces elasticus]|nr:hypothetical protein LTR27_001301 [Elasticomyces elasticus]